ncbi:class I SAM-dependent methyltransferase [Actinophytocola oryzae]|uniref:Cyclopropane-fatty-acyl-phospholipid synthase n=1 Tax=Actinophytocola oryzae TaxID=502181 RepID=A0A4R7W1Y5_9PSEU|nr:class I SAM-dependent methyltransferase [Actinophytocola oryzae]TDV56018.1 cyclopropane-fatty-acyl-phospholipid synthase [Actinophytocola oryzae]
MTDDIRSVPPGTGGAMPTSGLVTLLATVDIPGEIRLPDGSRLRVGTGEPVYTLTFRSDRALRTPVTELGIGRAYVSGDLDVTGDLGALFGVRQALPDKVPLRQRIRFLYDFARTPRSVNARAIRRHYSRGDDFYLTFIDRRFRFYSQGLFHSPEETIEEAAEHKLESMVDGLGLRPGMRLLDIGGGWGGVTQYCGARGVHVTTLTIAEDSARHVQRLIDEDDLPGEVFREDFLDHRPAEPYDHAVIYGVIEHLPNYRRFAAQVWRVLKPGGRLYLDASATIQKFSVSAFVRDYIWQGTHTFMALQDVIAELLYHGFEILDVTRETRDYELTMREWARRLDAAEQDITARWGEETYRAFRLFLWGGAHAFRTNALQAYHLVAERSAAPGPRPSTARRMVQFLTGLR